MSSYRFCRTDDIGLLVDALNHCWSPYFPDDPPMTAASFKRSIRDLQIWCSSCMVAFSGPEPIGVLIGAKRPYATLIHKIAVHPGHVRQGHGRHLLTSLGSKLAILGPPRMVAEIPETLAPAIGLFESCGYVRETHLADCVSQSEDLTRRDDPRSATASEHDGPLFIPITVDDLAANGLLGADQRQHCWERSFETLTARKDDIEGIALASDERIEAYLLYIKREDEAQIVALHSTIADTGTRVRQLLFRLRSLGYTTFRFPKVEPAEISSLALETSGFGQSGRYLRYAGTARSE